MFSLFKRQGREGVEMTRTLYLIGICDGANDGKVISVHWHAGYFEREADCLERGSGLVQAWKAEGAIPSAFFARALPLTPAFFHVSIFDRAELAPVQQDNKQLPLGL